MDTDKRMTPAQKIQASRRKTLFPLNPRQVLQQRSNWAWMLHRCAGLPIYAVRQILKCSPDQARNLVARGGRWMNHKK